MTAAFALAPLVRKEVRALLPIWLGAAIPLLASAATGSARLLLVSQAMYVIGATTLGAMSIGHEYAARTLGQLLAFPSDRGRLLGVKAAVLVLALASLGGLAGLTIARFVAGGVGPMSSGVAASPMLWTSIVLPLITGVTVAPWLTMLCRSPIAGVVFTLAAPAALWFGADAIVSARAGADEGDNRAFAMGVLWIGTAAFSAVTAVLARRTFMRLEDVGTHTEIDTSEWFGQAKPRGEGAARRSVRAPFLALLQKEVRLQSVAFLVAALYAIAWVMTWIVRAESPEGSALFISAAFAATTMLYMLFVPAIAGALPGAEERALGTVEWQVLQPYAAWKQWALKAATAIAVTTLLALILPLVLESLMPLVSDHGVLALREIPNGQFASRIVLTREPHILAIPMIVTCALYVSSFSRGGLRALLLTFPFVVVAPSLALAITDATGDLLWAALRIQDIMAVAGKRAQAGLSWESPWSAAVLTWWSPWGGRSIPAFSRAAFLAGFVLILLRLGFVNHRTAEGGAGSRIQRQMMWLAVYVMVASAIAGAVAPVALWALASGQP